MQAKRIKIVKRKRTYCVDSSVPVDRRLQLAFDSFCMLSNITNGNDKPGGYYIQSRLSDDGRRQYRVAQMLFTAPKTVSFPFGPRWDSALSLSTALYWIGRGVEFATTGRSIRRLMN